MGMSIGKRLGVAAKIALGQKGLTIVGDLGSIIGKSKPANYSADKAAAYVGKLAVVAACVRIWISEYAQARFAVQDDEGNPVYDHPVIDLLRRPGANSGEEWMDERELKRLIMSYKILTGTAYIDMLKPRSGVGRTALDVYGAGHVRHLSTRTKRLAGYEIRLPDGSYERREVTDMIRLPWEVPNPDDALRGLSPLQVCFTDAQAYEEVAKFVAEFLLNGAFPGSLLINKAGWESDESRRANQKEFREAFGGGRRGGVASLDGDIDFKAVAHGLKDLDLSALRDTPEAAICMAFGVPPELVGAKVGLDKAHLNNRKESRRQFTQGTLASVWEADAHTIGDRLLPELGYDTDTLIFDTSMIPLMREDTDARALRVTALFEKNLITRNEARAELNYDASDGGDLFFIDLQRVEQQAKVAGQKGTKTIGDDSDEERELTALWKAANDELDEIADDYSKAFAKPIEELRKQVMAEAADGKGLVKRDIDALSDENLRKLFLQGTEEEREEIAREIVNRAAKSVSFDPDEISTWLDDAIKDTIETSADNIKLSSQTMKSEITDILKDAGRATPDEIAEKLKDYFDILGGARLNAISVTTATAARSRGQLSSFESINKRRSDRKIIKNRWLTQRDGKVRDSHRAVDGVVKDQGETFNVGGHEMSAPGLDGPAEEVIHCRCVIVPKTVKAEE